jgi:hypothetical protein
LDPPAIPIEQWGMTEPALRTMQEITSTWIENKYPNYQV